MILSGVVSCGGLGRATTAPPAPQSLDAGEDGRDGNPGSAEAASPTQPIADGGERGNGSDVSVEVTPPPPPRASAESARIYYQDGSGTWFFIVGDAMPMASSFVPDTRRATIVPSPMLDKIALVRDGHAVTEIYDQSGLLLTTIPSDQFAGWASNESVVASQAKWDMNGTMLLAYEIPPNLASPTIHFLPYVPGRQLLSPDGSILALEPVPDYSSARNISKTVYFFSTIDGSVLWQGDLGFGDVSFWTDDGRFVFDGFYAFTVLGSDFEQPGNGSLPFAPCAGQAWAAPNSMLLWKAMTITEIDYTHDVCGEAYVVAADGSTSPPALFLDTPASADGSNTAKLVALSPDRRMIAFRPPTGPYGVSFCDPQGKNCRNVATATASAPVSAVAWDSPNYLAPLHDTTVAKPAVPLPTLSGGTAARPGPPGTVPSSDDCTQGRWYERTPEVLSTNWPLPRQEFASVYDPIRGVLVIDGGHTIDAQGSNRADVAVNNSTWEWDSTLGTWTNHSVTNSLHPLVLSDKLMVFDGNRSRVDSLVATWKPNRDPVNQYWSWDPATGMWLNKGCDSPYPGIPVHGFHDDSRDEIWVIDGNGNGTGFLPATCQWTSYTLPASAQTGGVFGYAFDTQRRLSYIVDGENLAGMVWEWSGATTKQRPVQGTLPAARRNTNVTFDQDRGRLMMFSGATRASGTTSSTYPADLWEWDPQGGGWTLCGSGSDLPPGRSWSTLVYDSKRHSLLLLGGFGTDKLGNSQAYSDVWEWAIP